MTAMRSSRPVDGQAALFDSAAATAGGGPGRRLDLPDADVVLHEHFFDLADSVRLYSELITSTAWRQQTIRFYGREQPIPRLTAWHGDTGRSYTYSGITMDAADWTPTLLEIKQAIESVCEEAFNSVLLNQYRGGRDSVAWHSDDELELGPNPIIGSVSLGATRWFSLRHKERRELTDKIELTDGSLLVMKGPTQRFWQHQVPKTTRPVDPRINLTFRRIQE
jgi:alkylated DNA repair dioxygenase AlkB